MLHNHILVDSQDISDYLNHIKEQALDWNNELKELVLGAIEDLSNHLDLI